MLRGVTQDIDTSVNGFIEDIFSLLNLGVIDNVFHYIMIGLSFVILGMTLFSLLIYRSLHRKSVKKFVLVIFYIWAFFAFIFSMLVFVVNYNWFGVQKPIAIFIDPVLGAMSSMIENSGDIGTQFFDSFVGSLFGSGMSLDNLSTGTVVKFFLKVPTIIAWIYIGIIIFAIIAINFSEKYEFIKMGVRVIYFICFFSMLAISLWAIYYTITADIKVGTAIEMIVKTQVKGITDGIVAGLDGVKVEADDMIVDIINKIGCGNGTVDPGAIEWIIKISGNDVIIGSGSDHSITLDIGFLETILGASRADIEQYVLDAQESLGKLDCSELTSKLEDAREWLAQV